MRQRSIHLLVFVLVALSLVACKKTEKGENNRWETGLQTVAQLSATYPGFKSALEQQKAKAETAMAEAKKVEDKKKRIDAMSKANNLLSGGFVSELSSADKRIKEIQKRMVSIGGDAKTEAEKTTLKLAVDQAKSAVAKVEKTLKSGAKDATSAAALLKVVDADLKHATEVLDEVSRKVAKREQGEKKAADDKAAAAKAEKDAKEAAVAPWTCEYCDHSNPHDATKCESCGAARPEKK